MLPVTLFWYESLKLTPIYKNFGVNRIMQKRRHYNINFGQFVKVRLRRTSQRVQIRLRPKPNWDPLACSAQSYFYKLPFRTPSGNEIVSFVSFHLCSFYSYLFQTKFRIFVSTFRQIQFRFDIVLFDFIPRRRSEIV